MMLRIYVNNAEALKYMARAPLPIFTGNTQIATDFKVMAVLEVNMRTLHTGKQMRSISTIFLMK